MKFKVGDVVKLNSGGPHMTVFRVGKTSVECVWFDCNINYNTGVFPEESLFASISGEK